MNPISRLVRHSRTGVGARVLFWLAGVFVAFGMAASAGTAAAGSFVDATLGDVKAEDKVVVLHPQPVQLLFQFHTKGAPNARATKELKDKVVETVKASGLFSDVSDSATANGAILNIVLDDVVDPGEMADAEGKGFVTGATFFIAGSTVKEHYLCTVDYVASPTAPKITRTARHAVVMQIGLINSTPQNVVKAASIKEAIYTMTRQIVANPLNAIAADPGFQGAPTPTVTTLTPASTTVPAAADQSPTPVGAPAPAAVSAPPAQSTTPAAAQP